MPRENFLLMLTSVKELVFPKGICTSQCYDYQFYYDSLFLIIKYCMVVRYCTYLYMYMYVQVLFQTLENCFVTIALTKTVDKFGFHLHGM